MNETNFMRVQHVGAVVIKSIKKLTCQLKMGRLIPFTTEAKGNLLTTAASGRRRSASIRHGKILLK